MATTDKTPLWLDLKKEYIDDNFNKLQTYLHDSAEKGSKDSFYTTTIELFRERISDLMRDISERPVFAEEQERQQLSTNVSMLATYLLADGDHTLALPAYVAFMNCLRQMNPSLSDLIVRTVMQRIRHEKVTTLGFSWKTLKSLEQNYLCTMHANRPDSMCRLPNRRCLPNMARPYLPMMYSC